MSRSDKFRVLLWQRGSRADDTHTPPNVVVHIHTWSGGDVIEYSAAIVDQCVPWAAKLAGLDMN